MSPYTRLVSLALFPLHEFLKSHDSVARRKQLERSQWLSADELRDRQLEKLRRFLTQIEAQVPFYRDVFQKYGFHAQDLKSLQDLARLPLLDKASIRAAGDRMKAANAGPLTRYNTGGSSGEPLIFFMGRGRKSHDVAAKWRATRWWGVDIGDPEVVVWGSPVELGAQDRLRMWRDRFMRSTLMPAFEMSQANLDRFVAQIAALRPKMLFGYPSSLSLIGEHARKRGHRLDSLGIKVAFVTSERLYDHQRESISADFGCPVANGYGARDAGFIAHECPSGGMHISAEDVVVEIVDSAGRAVPAGTSGEIVVTHLATEDFPFVRYRTGDIGILDDRSCACGRGLPMLREIQGRTTDFVIAADGTIMHGLALIYAVRDLPGVEAFKIVQHALDHVEVQLVVKPPFSTDDEAKIVEAYRARLGAGVRVEINRLQAIPNEKSGKFRYVISHLANRNQAR